MEEGGGHGFFVLVVVLLEDGEGEEEEDVFFLVGFVVCFSFGWLVGWLFFLSWSLAQGRYFSCINFLLSCRMRIYFFLFSFFFSLFFFG